MAFVQFQGPCSPKRHCVLHWILHSRKIRKSPIKILGLFQNNTSAQWLLGEHMPLSLRTFWERFLAKITENEESSTGPTGAWVVAFWFAFILNYSSFTRPYLREVWLALTCVNDHRNHTILLKQCLALINHVSSNRSQVAHVREP